MFLEVLTRHYSKRPASLERNQASLDAQTDDDWQQTLLVDDAGYGVAWANRQLGEYAPHLEGEYIWILDDDDLCVRPMLVSELKAIAQAHDPDLIMLRCDHGTDGAHCILPPDGLWGQAPQECRIGMSAFVVRRAVYQAHADAFPNALRGDFAFIRQVYADTPPEKVFWHDVVAMKLQWKGWGRAEA